MNDFISKENLNKIYYNRTDKLQHRLNAWEKYGTNKVKFFDWVISQFPQNNKYYNILDIGCGTGKLLFLLNKKYKESNFYGIDISPAMVKASKEVVSKKNRKNLIEADIKNLPFVSNYFEIVTATHVLYHVPNIKNAVKEMNRVLKPNGILFVTTTDYDLDQGLNKIHYQALKKLGFPKFMQDKKSYLRFTPKLALRVLNNYFPKVKICKFRNDLVYKKAELCLEYYCTAMMYRNSKGINDKRISAKMWIALEKENKNKIAEEINKKGKLLIKGRVFGFRVKKIL